MKFTLSNPLFGANDLIKVPKLYTIFFFKFSIKNLYIGLFWATEFEFHVKIWELKMADPIWRSKMQEVTKFE